MKVILVMQSTYQEWRYLYCKMNIQNILWVSVNIPVYLCPAFSKHTLWKVAVLSKQGNQMSCLSKSHHPCADKAPDLKSSKLLAHSFSMPSFDYGFSIFTDKGLKSERQRICWQSRVLNSQEGSHLNPKQTFSSCLH